jgi:hypothetical protein
VSFIEMQLRERAWGFLQGASMNLPELKERDSGIFIRDFIESTAAEGQADMRNLTCTMG